METVQIALDWTPNTNHTGFYIAKAKGWFAEHGLDVQLISPHVDDYKTTPLQRVMDGRATFAICPSESVISAHTHPDGRPKARWGAAGTTVSSHAHARKTDGYVNLGRGSSALCDNVAAALAHALQQPDCMAQRQLADANHLTLHTWYQADAGGCHAAG